MPPIKRRSTLALGLAASALGLRPYLALAQTAQASAEQRLIERGIELPPVTPVSGVNNVASVRTGNLVYLSGLGPVGPDGRFLTGKVGLDVTPEEANRHARVTGLHLLSVLRAGLGGSLDNVSPIVKVLGMVNATPEFTEHPRVFNGCSDLFIEVFGEARGRHARSAVGMASLPFGITVEIEAIFEVA